MSGQAKPEVPRPTTKTALGRHLRQNYSSELGHSWPPRCSNPKTHTMSYLELVHRRLHNKVGMQPSHTHPR